MPLNRTWPARSHAAVPPSRTRRRYSRNRPASRGALGEAAAVVAQHGPRPAARHQRVDAEFEPAEWQRACEQEVRFRERTLLADVEKRQLLPIEQHRPQHVRRHRFRHRQPLPFAEPDFMHLAGALHRPPAIEPARLSRAPAGAITLSWPDPPKSSTGRRSAGGGTAAPVPAGMRPFCTTRSPSASRIGSTTSTANSAACWWWAPSATGYARWSPRGPGSSESSFAIRPRRWCGIAPAFRSSQTRRPSPSRRRASISCWAP